MGARRPARLDPLFAEMAGALDDLPDELPEAFIEEAERRSGGEVPATFSEPDLGPGPADDDARDVVDAGPSSRPRAMSARTKLVCTLGPASATPKMVRGLVEAGASVFRINCSHGTPDDHARGVSIVREVEESTGLALAILADLPGSEGSPRRRGPRSVRVPVRAAVRDCARDGSGDANGACDHVPGSRRGPPRVGDRILLADGAVELTVVGIEGDRGAAPSACAPARSAATKG